MAFTEFYCESGGSNVNGGSNTGAVHYTSTNGNWNGTSSFTPTDGSTPASTVVVGDFASVYLDGATVAVYIARVTAVAAGVNGAITLSTTAKAGAAPASGATGRTIKSGGAWLGLNAASSFPFTLASLSAAVDSSSDQVRVNLKNDQTYTLTSSLDIDNSAGLVTQGYTSSVNDGGRATITTNVTSSYGTNWQGQVQTLVDLIFVNTGASNSNDIVRSNATGSTWVRCVFHGGRGSGLNVASTSARVIECEFYDNNKANAAGKAGLQNANSAVFAYYCYSHDNTGSNTAGFSFTGGTILVLDSCIADTNGGHGVEVTSTTSANSLSSLNCDYYNNTGDAIKLNTLTVIGGYCIIRNNNFIKNGGKGINNATTGQAGIADNNGYGSGTQANGGADTLGSIISSAAVTYASNVTPYTAPTTGNFSIILAAAISTGRGAFVETDGTNTGTVGYPDIGAAQALNGTGVSREVSYGFS